MSRVYFHSPSGEAELWGGERAWLGGLCSDIAVGILDPASNYDRLRSLVKPGHYVSQGGAGPAQWASSLALAVRVGFDGSVFAWNGHDIDSFDLVLNTAVAVGSDVTKLAARIHGQCEIHCYCEGIDRAWLAQLITRGRDQGVLRDLHKFRDLESSWESIARFLLDRDDEPVVMSYSVTDSFPNRHAADWAPPDDPDWIPEYYRDTDDWAAMSEDEREQVRADHAGDRWYDLPDSERWDLGMAALRARPGGLRLDPANWQDFGFGHGLSVLDLLAPDYRERLDAKFPALATAEASS
jgi:hypothetical protein